MAVDSDEEDFVFYGTPIEREEDTSARKRKAVADAGALRALPAWKEEVRDEEGRRRFHGAFTGGFSAGYYNTVGSKEGWTPQTFTSSRKSRAEVKQQSIYSFLDEEDIKAMGGHAIETSMQFDTFGFTAAEIARKQAEKEQQKRPSAIPGPVPDEIVVPAANSIGMKMLLKMGWRHGRSIADAQSETLHETRREARKAFLAFSGNGEGPEHGEVGSNVESAECTWKSDDDLFSAKNTPVFVLHPKQDLHGLGYDPFKHAPEFRDRKRLRESRKNDRGYGNDVSIRGNLLASNSGKYAPGFGIGALEELDLEDEDIYASGFEFEQIEVEEDEPSQMSVDNKYKLEDKVRGTLHGFKVASSCNYNLERFHPPVVPPDFVPVHKFSSQLETVNLAEVPPPEAPPPEDNNLRLLIDGFANLVAHCGVLFEDLSREKNKSNPLFSFLNGGNGHNYYARKLWEAKQRNSDKQRPVDVKSMSSAKQMTAENRGRILGEKPLERSSNEPSLPVGVKEVIHLQSNLANTFIKPESLVGLSEAVKPFKDDPAKQERFEQFLKDKYQGGLRSISSGGSNIISEADRARERLDFEAAAEALAKGDLNSKSNLLSTHQSMDLLGFGRQHFISSSGVEKNQVSQDEENMNKKIYPRREEFQWRPSPILCKRFDIVDPFMGKPPPLPRPRSKMDSLIFTSEFIKSTKTEETDAVNRDSMLKTQPEMQEGEKQPSVIEPEIESSPKNVERPVDLYKAIFSDDSDEDEDKDSFNQVTEPEKKTEGANTTLNRLIAGDFLESLGKELGLEVPRDTSLPPFKANSSTLMTENIGKDLKISSMNGQSSVSYETSRAILVDNDAPCRPRSPENGRNTAPDRLREVEVSSINGDGQFCANSKRESLNICSQRVAAGDSFHDVKEGQVLAEGREIQAKSTHFTNRQRRSSSPETDSSSGQRRAKKGRTRSRHHRSKHSTPDSDSFDDRHQPKRSKTHSRRQRSRSCSPDNDSRDDQRRVKKRTQSRHHREGRTPDSESPSDHRYYDHSGSRVAKRPSEGKNRKHSRHNKHR